MNRSVKKIFLPDGTWYDFITGKKFPGNHRYVSFFRDQDYPVFVKMGAIIPMADKEDIYGTKAPQNMEIQIFPGQSNNYVMYEDDGETNSRDLADAINEVSSNCMYVSSFEDCEEYLKNNVNKSDIVLTIGAGSVTKISHEITK